MRTDIPADCEKTQAPRPPAPFDYDPAQQNQADYGLCGQQSRPMSNAEILAELFSYHPPNPVTLPKFQAINQAAKNFAEVVLQNCPAGSDRSGAINCIRTARMVANAAIALNGLSL